ncbi:pyocin knob domain-containing protein [Stutzerimonas stutzeri]|uniref:pyocin knob domain-containing protein n=1 Tax=Stutzerimonas stutzeri TaxID=316 RepID=UPI001BCDC487|nr:pyocin knob domain-containing protein [Stutzerimonas stutzeri]
MTARRPLVLVDGQRKQLPTGDTLAGVVQDTDPRLTDAREWTATTVTQTEAEQGVATTRRAWTAQRVFQAVAAWWAASAAKTKLDGIASGATANATDAQLRDRATHTGTQAISTVTGLQTALDGKINTTDRGVSGGVATLDQNARIPASQLPSYVDDVLEYPTRQDFPATGEGGKIYVAINQGTAADPTVWWRWTGTTYVDIPPSPGTTDALVEGSTNLYFNEIRVRNTVLAGLSLASSAAVAATDSVLSAFGKIQARLNLLGTAANQDVQETLTDPSTGRLQKVAAFGGVDDAAYRFFRVTAGITTSGDCNNFQGAGVYQNIIASGGGVANAPDFGSGNYFYLQNYVRLPGAALTQIAWPYATTSNSGDLAWRGLNGTTWSPWVKAWHTGNFNPASKQDKSAFVTTATSRTLALTDAWNYLRPGTTSAITLTVPTNASVAFEIGTEITIRALGNITLAAASGVTLNAPSGGTLSMTARMTVTLKKVATNEWDVIGQTVAA